MLRSWLNYIKYFDKIAVIIIIIIHVFSDSSVSM